MARVNLDLDIGVPDPDDVPRFGAIAARSLGVSPERIPIWMERIGVRNLRVAHRGADVVGGLGVISMGHWFGGRVVPCTGISAVAVAPEHRSRGIAGELMRTALEEARRDGVPLSSLYPSTFPVYRAAGYETAGNRFVYRVPLANVASGGRELDVREATAEDHPTLRALYDARARTIAAAVERTRYFWTRIFEPLGEDARAYLVTGDAGPEGYVVVSYRPSPSPLAPSELPVRDIVARTPAAARRILRLLADHRSVARTATLAAGPGDPVLMQLREELPELADMQRWMLRVVDVRGALERRGSSTFATRSSPTTSVAGSSRSRGDGRRCARGAAAPSCSTCAGSRPSTRASCRRRSSASQGSARGATRIWRRRARSSRGRRRG